MAKSNIRSIRFSDEIAELIDRQYGDTFTQKFENLVTRCTWELPAKEEELKRLERKIQDKRTELLRLEEQIRRLKTLNLQLDHFQELFEKTVQSWEP